MLCLKCDVLSLVINHLFTIILFSLFFNHRTAQPIEFYKRFLVSYANFVRAIFVALEKWHRIKYLSDIGYNLRACTCISIPVELCWKQQYSCDILQINSRILCDKQPKKCSYGSGEVKEMSNLKINFRVKELSEKFEIARKNHWNFEKKTWEIKASWLISCQTHEEVVTFCCYFLGLSQEKVKIWSENVRKSSWNFRLKKCVRVMSRKARNDTVKSRL